MADKNIATVNVNAASKATWVSSTFTWTTLLAKTTVAAEILSRSPILTGNTIITHVRKLKLVRVHCWRVGAGKLMLLFFYDCILPITPTTLALMVTMIIMTTTPPPITVTVDASQITHMATEVIPGRNAVTFSFMVTVDVAFAQSVVIFFSFIVGGSVKRKRTSIKRKGKRKRNRKTME